MTISIHTLQTALREAKCAINSMKVEAETAAQGDEQMMLEACEQISTEGLAASRAIDAVLGTSSVHHIAEPAPAAVTAFDALREAEAALEVAIARILKNNPGHSISATSEAKALVAVRAALAAAPAADELTTLPAADASSDIQHWRIDTSAGRPILVYKNCSVIEDEQARYVMGMIASRVAPAPVALPEPDAQAMRAAGIEQVAQMLQKRADAYAEEHLHTDPDTGTTEGSEAHLEYWNWLVELVDDVRTLLAGVSAPAAEAVVQTPVLYVSKGQLENHRDPDGPESAVAGRYLPARITPAGNFTTPLFAAPQAPAADALDAARYRWLRQSPNPACDISLAKHFECGRGEDFEALIDAAIAAQAAAKEGAHHG